MDEKLYLKDRVDDQIKYYDCSSIKNKGWFVRLSITGAIMGVSIPFLTPYISNDTIKLKICLGLMGVGISLITALLAILKFQEHWMEYRTTCESLKHEKYLYLTKSGNYSGNNSFDLFVQRIESLISKENTAWVGRMKNIDKKVVEQR